ncbi:FAD-binding protein [Proteobacteria bacterium 005FR1]|nr:FAD-binding protein [Proteobacteria bacterium 005FR1]
MRRRQFLHALAALSAGSTAVSAGGLASRALAQTTATRTASSDVIPWRNWSASQICHPQRRMAPGSVDELRELVAGTRGVIRPVGSGHSFSALVPTDDTIVSLSRLSGILSHDKGTMEATLGAGTRLSDIGEPLAARGQAMVIMPDIDEQTLAGSIATATHGTGADIGSLSSFVSGLKLVTAKGDVIECSENKNPEIFKAAQVNLGALGIVTEITLRNVAPYKLKSETVWLPIEALLEEADSLAARNRNFEFFYIPFSGLAIAEFHNPTDEPVSPPQPPEESDGLAAMRGLRDKFLKDPEQRFAVMNSAFKDIPPEVLVAPSWQAYVAERNTRFNEMEYHLPREHAIGAFREIKELLETRFPEVFFPIEFRYIKADDAWLSPFSGRDSCSVAIHRVYDEDYRPFFAAAEPIFKKYRGRPHWGKINTLGASEFTGLYPRWKDFKELRQALDPDGKFLNPYLAGLFT